MNRKDIGISGGIRRMKISTALRATFMDMAFQQTLGVQSDINFFLGINCHRRFLPDTPDFISLATIAFAIAAETWLLLSTILAFFEIFAFDIS